MSEFHLPLNSVLLAYGSILKRFAPVKLRSLFLHTRSSSAGRHLLGAFCLGCPGGRQRDNKSGPLIPSVCSISSTMLFYLIPAGDWAAAVRQGDPFSALPIR